MRGPGKGKTNNPKGRPPGPNKTTKELKEFYVSLLSGETERIKEALGELFKENKVAYMAAIDKISKKVVADKRDITSNDESILPSITIIEKRADSGNKPE